LGNRQKKTRQTVCFPAAYAAQGMCVMSLTPEILSHADVRFLPIVAASVKKIGAAQEVDRQCAMESDVRLGIVNAMILDTLSGHTHLCRFERFCAELVTELLLYERIDAAKFNNEVQFALRELLKTSSLLKCYC
jgi:hypothetical protein